MVYTTLIEADTVAAHLVDPLIALVDCRFDLGDTEAGERAYLDGHIPGAVYAHLDRDLSGTKTGRNGRHPLPEPARVAETLGELGIDGSVQVVAYDEDSGMFASRLWWMLRWLGHETVAVLDGGFKAWLAAGRPMRSGAETRPARVFVPRPRADMVANMSDVRAIVGTREWRLLDGRAPERFRGETEPIDRAPGHIPGAVNHHFKLNIGDDGRFRGRDDLRAALRDAIGDTPPSHVVSYCGSGVTACQNLLALEVAGWSGARLYPGSWSEWASDPARPVEIGPGAAGARGTGGVGGTVGAGAG